MTVAGISVKVLDGAVCWQGGLAVDADGSSRAYHPDGKSGLDALGNAGHAGNWWGLVTDNGKVDGTPIVQGPHDLAPGFFVAPTSLVDKSKALGDPHRYVDSARVAYLSIPPELRAEPYSIHLGDVAMVVRLSTQATCPATVADIGPRGKLGEGSIALATALGANPSPRNGGASHGIAFVVFASSSKDWPRSDEDVQQQAAELFAAWGGLARLAIQVG